jgi:hypothetical protein
VSQQFHRLSLSEFGALVDRFPFTRRVEAVHVRASRFPLAATDIAAMLARQHRADLDRGWTDIGQHATVAPDGTIWTGRSWNRPPCSAAGRNGNRVRGPFLIDVLSPSGEIDLIAASQREALAGAIARLQRRMGLGADTVWVVNGHFRPAAALIDDVRRSRDVLERTGREPEQLEDRPFSDDARAHSAALSTLLALPMPPYDEPSWAEARQPSEFRPQAVAPSRRALCVGVDKYPTSPLLGCVADARLWQTTFDALGFQTELLLDEDATREAILARLRNAVDESRPGDIVAFQFSGHGTQVPDPGADETDRQDEAMCPVDFASGRLLVDDDVGTVMATIPEGVNVTLFIDCCHSGTINRFSVRPPVPAGTDERARFLPATDALIEAHRAFRANHPGTRAARPRMREVLFAACQPWELAWESQGQGDFTRKAVRRLRDVAGQTTHEMFVEQVTAAFGPEPRQHPLLTCAPEARSHVLLASQAAAV